MADIHALRLGHLVGDDVGAADQRRGVLLQEEVDQPFTAVRLRIETDGPATQAELDRVAADVARFCPVSKMLKAAGTKVTETWIARA